MPVSATQFRQNLYQILDQVLETGQPVEIERRGHLLRIVPEEPRSKWEALEPHLTYGGDSDELLDLDWSKDWKGGRDL